MCCEFRAFNAASQMWTRIEGSDQGAVDEAGTMFWTIFTTEDGRMISSYCFWRGSGKMCAVRQKADDAALKHFGLVVDWWTGKLVDCATAVGH